MTRSARSTVTRHTEPAEPIDWPEPTMSEADGVRYLHLGTPWVQGAMRIRKPNEIELEYVLRMMACLLLRPEAELAVGHALQFGLGAGAITRFCRHVMKMSVTAVEINPGVISLGRMYFRIPADSPEFQTVQADAAAYAADRSHAGSITLLCVDLYDDDAAGPVHDSEAFYRDCFRLLADGGVMSVNLFGRHASFAVSMARIVAVFGAASVASLQPTQEGNTIVVAAKSATIPDRAVLVARAQNIETRLGLPAKKWIRMVRPYVAPVTPAGAAPSADSNATELPAA